MTYTGTTPLEYIAYYLPYYLARFFMNTGPLIAIAFCFAGMWGVGSIFATFWLILAGLGAYYVRYK